MALNRGGGGVKGLIYFKANIPFVWAVTEVMSHLYQDKPGKLFVLNRTHRNTCGHPH